MKKTLILFGLMFVGITVWVSGQQRNNSTPTPFEGSWRMESYDRNWVLYETGGTYTFRGSNWTYERIYINDPFRDNIYAYGTFTYNIENRTARYDEGTITFTIDERSPYFGSTRPGDSWTQRVSLSFAEPLNRHVLGIVSDSIHPSNTHFKIEE
jgi:hypothetical protein